jgi:hypothetical protein
VNDHDSHFIDIIILKIINEFMMTHHKSIIYYPHGNGQAKSTNKILKQNLTKMVNVNQTNWDVMLSTF